MRQRIGSSGFPPVSAAMSRVMMPPVNRRIGTSQSEVTPQSRNITCPQAPPIAQHRPPQRVMI